MVPVSHSYLSSVLAGLLMLVLSVVMPAAVATQTHGLNLASAAALVMDNESGQVLYGKNADSVLPIASITKLMTAMVVLDANLDPEERLTVTNEDVDWLRGSHSRLAVGVTLTRDEMLRLALMASENRAAFALSRYYPGGREAFVQSMNLKAIVLGMRGTRYADPTGLSSSNVSTAEDLARLVRAGHEYDKIREYSTMSNFALNVGGRPMQFRNTNGLVMSPDWEIGLSKTGFINEAGRCLVMQAKLAGRAVVIVLLDSVGRYTRTADATRIRRWLEVAAGYVAETKAAVRSATRAKATRSAQARTPAPVVRTRATTRPVTQSGARIPTT
mgnify:CR=1 FL=1